MKFTLKDYQQDAVRDVLRNLADARDDYQRRGRRTAFSLTATTGAGKTVMAAAVIEALFHGNDDADFPADPSAVVLWFTDDPSLNEQTRTRLLEAGDQLDYSRLRVIENTFNEPWLDTGKVYFLNAQKLSSNSRLVRGGRADPAQDVAVPTPDLREYTMWDTLRNTIEDESRTLYVILDEAHKGMRTPSSRERNERQTIVRRLVNGADGVPAVPIVWGISATVQRFTDAMAEAQDRVTYPPVAVDPVRVQESGLLKNDIRLDFPTERGQFDTTLLRRGVDKLRELSDEWRRYAAQQQPPLEPVLPLLVVQVPNTPSDELLRSAIDTVREAWPELGFDAMAHVFGEHAPIELGGHTVPYVSPEKVQDRTYIRVLFAKDAISTGWDCPRAEVLVSFRPAADETHITQLLGRMVRTPLARSVPGNDRLNSVDCVLPHFDRGTATAVANAMLGRGGGPGAGGDGGDGDGRRVLVRPVDMGVNTTVPEQVWEAFDRLPSQSLPRQGARPVKRLAMLAQALATDELRPFARRDAYREMFAVLDGLAVRFEDRVIAAADAIRTVEGQSIVAGIDRDGVTDAGTFREAADRRSIEADFALAQRVLSPDLARKYAGELADRAADDDDDGLLDAQVQVAALAAVPEVRDELDRAADELARRWQTQYRVAIRGLSDDRRAVYDEIIAASALPQRIDVLRPRVRTEETVDGDGSLIEVVEGHLMADEQGHFPIGGLNAWERAVLGTELARPDALAWYRNPGRASADALAVAYEDGTGRWRRLCPDFLFFHGTPGRVDVSIVDPHGIHLADAIPKLRGLAVYAAEFGAQFHRIEAIADLDGELHVLDLQNPLVRQAIESATDARALYERAGTPYA